MTTNKWAVWVDGASSPQDGKDGAAGAGWFLCKLDEDNKPRFVQQGGDTFNGTNNYAEVYAIQLGLQAWEERREKGDTLLLYGDSQWALYCFAKYANIDYLPNYNTDKYPELFETVLKVYRRLKGNEFVRMEWTPREANKDANRLAQMYKERGKKKK